MSPNPILEKYGLLEKLKKPVFKPKARLLGEPTKLALPTQLKFKQAPVPLIRPPKEIPRWQKAVLTPIAPTEPQQRALITGFRTAMEGWRRVTEAVRAPLFEYQRAVLEGRPTLDPTIKAIPEALKGLRYTPGTEIVKNMGVPLDDPKWILENPGKHFAAQMLGAWYETYGTDPIIMGLWARSIPYARKANLFNQLVRETGRKIRPAMLDRARVPIAPKLAKKLSEYFGKGFWGRQTQVAGGLKKVSEAELRQAINAIRNVEYVPRARLAPPITPRVTPEVTRPLMRSIMRSPTVRPPEVRPPIIRPPIPRPEIMPPRAEIEPLKPIPVAKATTPQIRQAHIIAREKALITPEGKTKPGYRRLAEAMTGKRSVKDMTQEEASRFISSLQGISEPYYKRGKLLPPSIPKTTRIVPEGFFKREFKEPTIAKLFTSQTYYSELLGVKPFVEPLEIAKQKFDLSYRNYANNVSKMIVKIDKLGKTTFAERVRAKVKNIPTKAVSRMRDLLDKYEEPPAFLSPNEKEVFNWFRNLNRTILEAENVVRRSLDLEPIRYRKAYVRHTAETMAYEMLMGKYPFPEGLKYWSQKVIGKKIFNPMEFRRQLADDLEGLWTKDLAHATKSMLWTGLKETHLSQPLKFLNEQLGVISKDPAIYKDLTPEEKAIYDLQRVMPASTKRWLIDYVNQVLKGQETDFDASVNRVVTTSGLRGLLNMALKPFGRAVGRKPITGLFQAMGRLTIHGVMGPIRPKQLIRNKFQLVQNLALYGIKANLKGFFPATKQMKQLINKSLFLKTYTGFEELPTNIQGKLERLNLAPFQWTAVSNVSQSMKVAYWDTLDLIANSKYKELNWADPSRTYTEAREFLYPSEKDKILKEMEFGSGITQYGYIPMAMPEIFRYKALVPFTRLQSWWMNHFFKFNREAIYRVFKGETGYGAKLPWSRRLGYLRYLILGGIILNSLDYERSFLFGAAPTGLPPTAQFMLGLYTYVFTSEKTDWGKRKKAEAKRRMFYAMKTFIPGHLAWKDFNALMSGEKQLSEYFFYKKIKKPPTVNPILEKYGVTNIKRQNPVLIKYGVQ